MLSGGKHVLHLLSTSVSKFFISAQSSNCGPFFIAQKLSQIVKQKN